MNSLYSQPQAGKKYHGWPILSAAGSNRFGVSVWRCLCSSCGVEGVRTAEQMRRTRHCVSCSPHYRGEPARVPPPVRERTLRHLTESEVALCTKAAQRAGWVRVARFLLIPVSALYQAAVYGERLSKQRADRVNSLHRKAWAPKRQGNHDARFKN